VVPVCSGAERPENPNAPTVWNCAATPPAVRADGCPGSPPDGACADEGQRCSYGDCCVSIYECHTTWQLTDTQCPP